MNNVINEQHFTSCRCLFHLLQTRLIPSDAAGKVVQVSYRQMPRAKWCRSHTVRCRGQSGAGLIPSDAAGKVMQVFSEELGVCDLLADGSHLVLGGELHPTLLQIGRGQPTLLMLVLVLLVERIS